MPIASWRKHLSLVIIGIIAALNYVDRQAITVVQDDIKAEFALSDTVVGMISGLYFALVYGFAAIPFARLADQSNRSLLVGACLSFWSLATAACGLVANAWQLAVARMTMAVGEAGAAPAGLALLTDIYSQRRRALVIGFYYACNSAGLSGGVMLTAWLASFLDWREVFLLLGLPGVALGIISIFLIVEPRKHGASAAVKVEKVPLKDVTRIISSSPTFRWATLLLLSAPMVGLGFLMWGNSFLKRVHGFSDTDLAAFGLAILFGMVGGGLVSGWVSDRLGQRGPAYKGAVAGAGLVLAFPCALGFALASDPVMALFCFFGLKFFMTMYAPPMLSMCCDLVPSAMRATVIALFSLITIVAGQGLGTLFVGMMNDAYASAYGDMAVRYSLTTISVLLLVAAGAAVMAGRAAAKQGPYAPATAAPEAA
jgi:MFS family permease